MRHTQSPIGVAADLLAALRAAGCKVFIDDGDLFCSPPLRPIAWPGNAEQAFESWYDDPQSARRKRSAFRKRRGHDDDPLSVCEEDMPAQPAILGTGSLENPPELSATSPGDRAADTGPAF